MKYIQLKFQKIVNHWYPVLKHEYVQDLQMDPHLEKFLTHLDVDDMGYIDNIYLIEQGGYIVKEGLIQFSDKDMLRYFTTNDSFNMDLYISDHRFNISSELYSLYEFNYSLDLHQSVYRIHVY